MNAQLFVQLPRSKSLGYTKSPTLHERFQIVQLRSAQNVVWSLGRPSLVCLMLFNFRPERFTTAWRAPVCKWNTVGEGIDVMPFCVHFGLLGAGSRKLPWTRHL